MFLNVPFFQFSHRKVFLLVIRDWGHRGLMMKPEVSLRRQPTYLLLDICSRRNILCDKAMLFGVTLTQRI